MKSEGSAPDRNCLAAMWSLAINRKYEVGITFTLSRRMAGVDLDAHFDRCVDCIGRVWRGKLPNLLPCFVDLLAGDLGGSCCLAALQSLPEISLHRPVGAVSGRSTLAEPHLLSLWG